MSMPRQTDHNNRYTSLRAGYDAAFRMLCRARKEYETRARVVGEDVRCLRADVDLAQIAFIRARNELAFCLLERRARRRLSIAC